MRAAREIFAFQVVPGTDETLGFAKALGIARQEASQHFEGLRSMEANIDAGTAIYNVGLKDPSLSDVVALLNHPEDASERGRFDARGEAAG
jgi:hypothetical protein